VAKPTDLGTGRAYCTEVYKL